MRVAAGLAAAAALAGFAHAADKTDPGERAFQRCYACHSIVAGETDLPGPNLRGVVGRRAGALPGYDYSAVMVEAGRQGLVWTREALDALMADTERFLPGTTMSLPPLKDAATRAAIVDYLERER